MFQALILSVLYLATALAMAAIARAGVGSSSRAALLILALLPLAYTAAGFLPGRTLAPTAILAGVPPWAGREVAALFSTDASAANLMLLDPVSQMEPWRRAAREDLLFNPAQDAGAALLGNGQSAALFPLELVARLLEPANATVYLQATRLLLAAFGMFVLLRSLALSELAALAGAAIFVGTGFIQLWRTHPHSYVAAVAPWILWGLLGVARRPRPGAALALGVAGALGVAAGHPETLFQIFLFVLLVALLALAMFKPDRRRLVRILVWGGAAALLAFLLAAPALLPFVETLRTSAEWDRRQHHVPQRFEIPLKRALPRLAPAFDLLAFGDPIGGTWLGPENLAELGGGSLGSAALLLAPLALLARKRRGLAFILLGLGLAGLLAAAHMPWIWWPFGAVPFLERTLVKRLCLWWALGGSVAAAIGLENLRRGRGRRTATAVGLVLAAGLAALALAYPTARTISNLGLELGALGIALCAGLALRSRRSGRLAAALVLAALIAPRAGLFSRWVPLSSAASFYPETEPIRAVRGRAAGWRVAGLGSALLPQSAAFFGLEEVRGYDPMTFAPYAEFIGHAGTPTYPGWTRLSEPAQPILSFLGVRFIFGPPRMRVPAGLFRIYGGREGTVFENPGALPRLFIPASVALEQVREKAIERAAKIGDFRRLAIVGEASDPTFAVRTNGDARVMHLAVSTGRIKAAVASRTRSFVATSQPAIPGWFLKIDGVEATPARANGAFLGAWVEPGNHLLAFRYTPASWTLGKGLFGIGLLLAGLLAVKSQRERRGGPSRPGGVGIRDAKPASQFTVPVTVNE
ncbi:MAG: YfhO family protein [Acidobacteriota bacterium]